MVKYPWTMFSLMCLLLGVGVWTTPTLVHADNASTAKAHYDKGIVHFKKKAYAKAVGEFNKAYRLSPSPTLVYNMARAFEELEEFQSAIEFYGKYLKLNPTAEDRERVQASLRALELLRKNKESKAKQSASLETGTLRVVSTPSNGKVLVDGQAIGRTPVVYRGRPGTHSVAVELDGYSRSVDSVTVKAKEQLDHQVTLIPLGASVVKKPRSSDRTIGWTLVALGSAVALGAALSGVETLNAEEALSDSIADPSISSQRVDEFRERGRRWALTTDVLWLTATGSLVTGSYFLLREPR